MAFLELQELEVSQEMRASLVRLTMLGYDKVLHIVSSVFVCYGFYIALFLQKQLYLKMSFTIIVSRQVVQLMAPLVKTAFQEVQVSLEQRGLPVKRDGLESWVRRHC